MTCQRKRMLACEIFAKYGMSTWKKGDHLRITLFQFTLGYRQMIYVSLRNLAAILAVSRDYTSHRIPLPRKSMFAISMFRTLCLYQRRCIRISLSLHLNTVPLKTQHAHKSLSLFMDAINLEESTFKIVQCVGDHYRNKYCGALFVSVLSNILIVLTLRSVRHSLCSSLLRQRDIRRSPSKLCFLT